MTAYDVFTGCVIIGCPILAIAMLIKHRKELFGPKDQSIAPRPAREGMPLTINKDVMVNDAEAATVQPQESCKGSASSQPDP